MFILGHPIERPISDLPGHSHLKAISEPDKVRIVIDRQSPLPVFSHPFVIVALPLGELRILIGLKAGSVSSGLELLSLREKELSQRDVSLERQKLPVLPS